MIRWEDVIEARLGHIERNIKDIQKYNAQKDIQENCNHVSVRFEQSGPFEPFFTHKKVCNVCGEILERYHSVVEKLQAEVDYYEKEVEYKKKILKIKKEEEGEE